MTYYAYMTFSVDSTTRVSAVSLLPDAEEAGTPSGSAKKLRRKTNSNGLQLTQSGRVSMASNEVNVKFDSSYTSRTGCALACTECTCTLGSAHGKGAHSP